MLKRIVSCLAICAMAAATVAQAQPPTGGGGGGGGGGGRHGGHGKGGGGGHSDQASSPEPPPPPDKPLNKVEITGVVTAIDPQAGRLTIRYEPVEVLNWPEGTNAFVVAKSALLQGVTVGEKVRFKIESQQISELRPF
jgi:hypothetical protein